MARPLRGGGVKAGPLKKYFSNEISRLDKYPMAIKIKALMTWPLVEELFFSGFPKHQGFIQ